MNDSEIVGLLWERSERALSALAQTHGKLGTSIAHGILGCASDAEECVNDAYLAVWNTIPPRKPDPLRAYFLRIVRNIALARYHKNTAQCRNSRYDTALSELEEVLADISVEETLEAAELARLIDGFLASLRREERVLFVRRYWYSDSVKSLAAAAGISENHAAVRLARIRRRLRNYLEKNGVKL